MKRCHDFPLITLILAWFYMLFLMFLPAYGQAQTAPYKLWDKTFGGCGTDDFTCMKPTADGGYILGGTSISKISGDKSADIRGWTDYWIVKTDANGNKLWDKTIGGNFVDDLKAIEQTPDGGYVLAGWSYSEAGGEKSQNAKTYEYADYWVLKLDANGNKIWDKIIGGNYNDYLSTMIIASDGGIILVGWSGSDAGFDKTQSTIGSTDAWIVKLDSRGNKLWDKTLGGIGSDNLKSIQETADGGFILGGTNQLWASNSSQDSFGGYDYWVVKLNSAGNTMWSKTFGGTQDDMLTSVRQTSDGGYLVGGYSSSEENKSKSQGPIGGNDYWVLKLNAKGIKEWDKVFGGSGNDLLYAIRETFDGGFILGGSSASAIGFDKSEGVRGGSDYWILKVDDKGNKLWDKTLGGNMDDELLSLEQTSDGNFVLGGTTESEIGLDKSQYWQGFEDFWVIRLVSPETPINTKFAFACNGNGTSIQANIMGIPPAKAGLVSWTLTYLANGTEKTATGTSSSIEIEKSAAIGNTYTLKKIETGTFIKNLTESVTVRDMPDAPKVSDGSKCGTGSVTLTAKGAGVDGKYAWYTNPEGGEWMEINSSGSFTTPHLGRTTTFYVSIINSTGCEGPRTPVKAYIDDCYTTLFPNVITPDNDGAGDTFIPQRLSPGKWAITIFDNAGIKNFESDNYQNNWPVKRVSSGVYYFILSNNETGKQHKGRLVVVQ